MFERTSWMTLAIAMALSGCYGSTADSEAAGVSAALEMENGGLSMEDEAPAFGEDETLDELDMLGEDPAYEDEMASDAEVEELRNRPDAIGYRVHVEWGRIPAELVRDEPTNWSGALVVNRGALIVNRAVRFEPVTDHLLPRSNPRIAPFSSVTLPHHDGVVLTLLDPDPANAEPFVLSYATREGRQVSVPLARLLDGPTVILDRGDGDRMIAVAHAGPVDICQGGFMAGHWETIRPDLGRFIGRVAGQDGTLMGHVRGIYGTREDGERVLFAKYINRDGEFQGILRGTYGDGGFHGAWADRNGERGPFGGQYRPTPEPGDAGGHFIGRWAEATCNLRL